jgi:hypothetical protein
MYERGEITEEEYVRLRDRVSDRVKQTLQTPTAAQSTGATEPTPPVPPPADAPGGA